jgi:hypothetical protein
MSDRLVAFLYVLMRDEVTSGTVEKIMQDHVESHDGARSFSNPHLEAHARELAGRLSKGE